MNHRHIPLDALSAKVEQSKFCVGCTRNLKGDWEAIWGCRPKETLDRRALPAAPEYLLFNGDHPGSV